MLIDINSYHKFHPIAPVLYSCTSMESPPPPLGKFPCQEGSWRQGSSVGSEVEDANGWDGPGRE